MQKRLITLIICILVLVNGCMAASASVPYTEDFAINLVRELEIMIGDNYGNMNLGSNLTRAEFTKIAINASSYKNSVAHGAKISVFKDCNYKHWAAPYVKVAVTNNIITGYPDATFRPDNYVTYEEAFSVMLKLLGYTSEDFGNTWPYGQISLGENIGLGDNISKGIGDVLTRKDALVLVYNTLNAKVKGSDKEYISKLDATLLENVVIIATNDIDTSVAPGTVLTNNGTYRFSDNFDSSYVGTKGDLAVKTNGEIICYTPYAQKNSKFVVYSMLSDSLIVYNDGILSELDVSGNTTVYSGSDKLSFSSAKNQMSIGDVIYVVKNSNNKVEYLTLTKDSLKGPNTLAVYSSNWYKAYSTDGKEPVVLRNGTKTSVSEVKSNDIIYYSRDLNTVFAYSKTFTGIYEKAIPNKDTPTSVIVSGTEYEIESVEAFNKLSSGGDFSYGSTVKLLFGKDGKIADVITADSDTESVVGYVVSAGKKNFENIDGESYSSNYVVLALPDGSQVEYTTENDCTSAVNYVVSVQFIDTKAKLSKLKSQNTVTGTIDSKTMTMDDCKIASDVEILDVSGYQSNMEPNVKSTYLSRIDGVNIGSKLIWCQKNQKGEINKMILNDVTGDTAVYGIATTVPEIAKTRTDDSGNPIESKGMSSSNGNYRFDVDGKSYSFSGGLFRSITSFSPAKLNVSMSGQVQTISSLAAAKGNIASVSGNIIEVDEKIYKLSDKVIIYKMTGIGTYDIIPLSQLAEEITVNKAVAYYDKDEKNGGRVRIIMVY